jgi:hypothetical protein
MSQSQDSLMEQLAAVAVLADKEGYYDASDYIRRIVLESKRGVPIKDWS